MHRYLRAIGFSNLRDGKELQSLLKDVFQDYDDRQAVRIEDQNCAYIEFWKMFGPGFGIRVCGHFDEEGFHQEFYFPFFNGSIYTEEEDVAVESHSSGSSYAGICEDPRIGVTFIFYLQNIAQYRQRCALNCLPKQKTIIAFSGLSREGTILFPVQKYGELIPAEQEAAKKRSQMIAAARKGDAEALESLTLEDMDTYTMVSRRLVNEDVFSIVDTYFMPYGVECDQYQVLANIREVKKSVNTETREVVYQMRLECNDLLFDLCINKRDLTGEPEEGYRFKGIVWMQGRIDFPEM